MNIASYYNQYNYTPNFTSTCREVYNEIGELLYRNDTCFFRKDIGNWNKFTEYIGNKFKDCAKANIYSLSCSSGDEVYSLAMKLIDKYGEKGAEKFFPIIASDYDSKVIKMANKGYLPMFDEDIHIINTQTHNKFDDYFEILDIPPKLIDKMDMEPYCDYDFIVKVKDKLKNKIIFKQADATKQCKTQFPDNSIVMVRNFWPYLKDEQTRIQLANDLYKSLGKNSAAINGDFDDDYGVYSSKNLKDAGFISTFANYHIWEKNPVPIDYCWADFINKIHI